MRNTDLTEMRRRYEIYACVDYLNEHTRYYVIKDPLIEGLRTAQKLTLDAAGNWCFQDCEFSDGPTIQRAPNETDADFLSRFVLAYEATNP